MKVKTKEMGFLDLFLIYDYGGTWESEWRSLQGHEVARLFGTVGHDDIEHAILGWSKPLVTALGPTPAGCLIKLPSRECAHRGTCPMYIEANCVSTAKKMPVCYDPDGIASSIWTLVAEAIRLWREGVYVVVVQEPPDAG